MTFTRPPSPSSSAPATASAAARAPASAASASTASPRPRQRTHHYTLFALRGRIYISNAREKLIDLGTLHAEAGAVFAYTLDGDHTAGAGFATETEALNDIGEQVAFLFLDGQFTSLPDLSDAYSVQLADATRLEIAVAEHLDDAPAS